MVSTDIDSSLATCIERSLCIDDAVPPSSPGSLSSSTSEKVADQESPTSNYSASIESSRSSTPDDSIIENTDHLAAENDISLLDHPYFEAKYQRILQENKMLCWLIKDRLNELKDPNLDSLIRLAHKIGTTDSCATKTIAVLGDSGVGKSTLLNSLLDCSGLAKVGEIGVAVTCVPTEFKYLEGNSKKFKLEVEYQTRDEIRQTIREYVWNLQSLQLPDMNEETISTKEYLQMQLNAKVANSALNIIFGNHSDLERVCRRQDEASYEFAVGQLSSWAEDLEWPLRASNGRLDYETDNAEDCTRTFSEFTSGNLWPLIKVGRIYLKSPILEHGVVLVDLPGLRDTNAARVKATQEYLAKADHVFVVADIGRAASNQTIQGAIFDITKQNFPNEWETGRRDRRGLTIICTRSEEMDLENIGQQFVAQGISIRKKEIEELKAKHRNAGTPADRKMYKKQLLHRLMDVRNSYISKRLKQTYSSMAHGQELKVYCISNKEYSKGRKENDISRITASQIPNLRKDCFRIIADSRLAEAQIFLTSALPGLLQSIKLHTSPKVNVSQELLDTISSTEQQLLSIQNSTRAEFEFFTLKAKAHCLVPLLALSPRACSDWSQDASKTHKEYTSWHHSSYDAFIRNNGTHATDAVRHRSWNNEMSGKMHFDLSNYWEILEAQIQDHFKKLLSDIQKYMTQLQLQSEKLPGFSQSVQLLLPSIELEIANIQFAAFREIRFVQSKATEDNCMSFMFAAMLPTYREAAGISGKRK